MVIFNSYDIAIENHHFYVKLPEGIFTCIGPVPAPSPSPWHRDGDAVSWAPCPSESRNFQAVLREGDRILRPWLFPNFPNRKSSWKRHQKGAPWLELTQPDPTQKKILPHQTEQIPIWSCAMDAKWWQQTQTVSQHVSTCLIGNTNDLLTVHGNRLRKD